MRKYLPTEAEIRRRAEPHLRKLTLGKHFQAYQAGWSGQDARDFVMLIDEICGILDHQGPALLDEICAQRREQAGLPSGRGEIVAASRERQILSGGYADLMEANCDLLRAAADERQICCWNELGCSAMHSVVEELIRKATCVLPAVLDRAGRTPPHKLDRMKGFV